MATQIDRSTRPESFHGVHNHVCPNCERPYTCNCHVNRDKQSLVCRDCETGTYNPVVHGGKGNRSEA